MDKDTIAKKLLDYRGKKSKSSVAESVGVSMSAISMYETGQRVPRDEIKLALANYYDTTVEELFLLSHCTNCAINLCNYTPIMEIQNSTTLLLFEHRSIWRLKMKNIPGLQYKGTVIDEEYGELPLYEVGGFINTLEGWNLFAKYSCNDMQKYLEVKKRYEEGLGCAV